MRNPILTKCTQTASKVTTDVVDWIKKLHVDPLSSGKNSTNLINKAWQFYINKLL